MEQKLTKKCLQTSKDSQLVLVTDNVKSPGKYVFWVHWPSEYSRQDIRVRTK